jgi:hypothetical protein
MGVDGWSPVFCVVVLIGIVSGAVGQTATEASLPLPIPERHIFGE